MADSMNPPSHHVAMMQIDCQVMNTKLIHVNEEAIPANLGGTTASNNGRPHERKDQQKSNSTSHVHYDLRPKP